MGGDDVFEYHVDDDYRSDPMKLAQFLSYIAPYWFCSAGIEPGEHYGLYTLRRSRDGLSFASE